MSEQGFTVIEAIVVIAIVGIMAAILLPVIFWRGPESGTVLSKWYEEPRTWVQMVPISTGKTTIMVPITHYDDEDWCIEIENDGKRRVLYVSESVYETVQLGAHFGSDAPGVSTSDPIEKRRDR